MEDKMDKITIKDLLDELGRFPGDLIVEHAMLHMKTDAGVSVSYDYGKRAPVTRSPINGRGD